MEQWQQYRSVSTDSECRPISSTDTYTFFGNLHNQFATP
jgi:hypothetical protein